ncbi:hypothetical protein EJB05_43706, partial [Eragrostis curvula]
MAIEMAAILEMAFAMRKQVPKQAALHQPVLLGTMDCHPDELWTFNVHCSEADPTGNGRQAHAGKQFSNPDLVVEQKVKAQIAINHEAASSELALLSHVNHKKLVRLVGFYADCGKHIRMYGDAPSRKGGGNEEEDGRTLRTEDGRTPRTEDDGGEEQCSTSSSSRGAELRCECGGRVRGRCGRRGGR